MWFLRDWRILFYLKLPLVMMQFFLQVTFVLIKTGYSQSSGCGNTTGSLSCWCTIDSNPCYKQSKFYLHPWTYWSSKFLRQRCQQSYWHEEWCSCSLNLSLKPEFAWNKTVDVCVEWTSELKWQKLLRYWAFWGLLKSLEVLSDKYFMQALKKDYCKTYWSLKTILYSSRHQIKPSVNEYQSMST